jgi:hypothetical protein
MAANRLYPLAGLAYQTSVVRSPCIRIIVRAGHAERARAERAYAELI